jgi:DNA-binding response OmpR family regulator
MQNVLLIDDDIEISTAVKESLIPLNINVEQCQNIQDGYTKLLEKQFSLILIDIHLPDGSGFDLYQKILSTEQFRTIPVVFLTANDDLGSKISAFSLGADDYVVKPFHLLELRARIERRLKSKIPQSLINDHYSTGPFTFDLSSQTLKIAGNRQPISLTPREFKILLLLARNPNRIFSRDDILDKIWGKDIHVTDRTVDAHICYIRKKLENHSKMIRSLPGEGYRLQLQESV